MEENKMAKKPVPDMLRDAAGIYEQRNKIYGDNYKKFGPALQQLFPNVVLRTPDDFNRFGILVQLFSKMSRYCNAFANGGHDDSLDDIAVYAMMLKELDVEARNNKVTADISDAMLPKIAVFGNHPEAEAS
jgi:hypothetical protein